MMLSAVSCLTVKGMFDAIEDARKHKKGGGSKFPGHPLPAYVPQPRTVHPTQDLMPYVVAGALFGVL